MRFADIAKDLNATPASYLKAARLVTQGQVEGLTPVRVGVVASFTAQVISPYLVVEGAARGLRVEPLFGPFNQLEQQLLDPKSELHAHQPKIIVILARLEELAPELAGRFLPQSEAAVNDSLAALEKRIGDWLTGVRRISGANVLIANFAPPSVLAAGLADASLALSQTSVIQKANTLLAAVCAQHPGVAIFDYARLVLEEGLAKWTDRKLQYLGRIPFSAAAQLAVAKRLARCCRALIGPPAKCLVLDLDNTLWGGVLGEEGVGGVALGEDFPGNAFKAFQKYVLSLKDRGILLALASKNNEADVKELFATHPDCVVKFSDFATWRINWQEKPLNLQEMAQELNIGVDSLVFFDDNPVERAEMRQHLPAVTVLEVPATPEDYIPTIEDSGVFDRLALSAEDQQRAQTYAEQRVRTEARESAGSTEDFLHSLQMVATLGHIGPDTIARVTQLLGKTNQFNLTTRRHSAGDIDAMLRAGGIGLWLRVADKFGDNGLIAVALAVPETPERWRIDTVLMSCRVIGRNVETAFLAELLKAIAARGGKEVRGEFLPTPKNTPVIDFYSRHGFTATDATQQWWHLSLAESTVAVPPYIQIQPATP